MDKEKIRQWTLDSDALMIKIRAELDNGNGGNPEPPYSQLGIEGRYFTLDGEKKFLTGYCDVSIASIWTNNKGFDWSLILDTFDQLDINLMRISTQFLDSTAHIGYPDQFNNVAYPYVMPEGYEELWDCLHVNPVLLSRLDQILYRNHLKGRVTQLDLSNCWGDAFNWDSSPHNPVNNIHDDYQASKWEDIYDDSLRFSRYQRSFIMKIHAIVEKYPLVFYKVNNERGSKKWLRYFAKYIKANTGRLVAVDDSYNDAEPHLKDWCDIVVFHTGGMSEVDKILQKASKFDGADKVIFLDEDNQYNRNKNGTRETVNQTMRSLWNRDDPVYHFGHNFSRMRGTDDPDRPSEIPVEILVDKQTFIHEINPIS